MQQAILRLSLLSDPTKKVTYPISDASLPNLLPVIGRLWGIHLPDSLDQVEFRDSDQIPVPPSVLKYFPEGRSFTIHIEQGPKQEIKHDSKQDSSASPPANATHVKPLVPTQQLSSAVAVESKSSDDQKLAREIVNRSLTQNLEQAASFSRKDLIPTPRSQCIDLTLSDDECVPSTSTAPIITQNKSLYASVPSSSASSTKAKQPNNRETSSVQSNSSSKNSSNTFGSSSGILPRPHAEVQTPTLPVPVAPSAAKDSNRKRKRLEDEVESENEESAQPLTKRQAGIYGQIWWEKAWYSTRETFQKAETILDIKKSVTTYGSGRPTEVRDVHIIDGGRLCHDDERLDALEQPANLEIIYRYTATRHKGTKPSQTTNIKVDLTAVDATRGLKKLRDLSKQASVMQIFDALEAQHNMSDLSKTFVLYDIGARQKILPIMHDQLLLDRTYLVLRKKLPMKMRVEVIFRNRSSTVFEITASVELTIPRLRRIIQDQTKLPIASQVIKWNSSGDADTWYSLKQTRGPLYSYIPIHLEDICYLRVTGDLQRSQGRSEDLDEPVFKGLPGPSVAQPYISGNQRFI